MSWAGWVDTTKGWVLIDHEGNEVRRQDERPPQDELDATGSCCGGTTEVCCDVSIDPAIYPQSQTPGLSRLPGIGQPRGPIG